MIILEIDRVLLLGEADAPVVVLSEVGGSRMLPIWVSPVSAQGIVDAWEGNGRPSTHDLLARVLATFGPVTEIVIESCQEGVFAASLLIAGQKIMSRASDAIALALSVDLPILCQPRVLEDVGVTIGGDPGVIPAEEVEKFIEFLDQITPEDFEKPK